MAGRFSVRPENPRGVEDWSRTGLRDLWSVGGSRRLSEVIVSKPEGPIHLCEDDKKLYFLCFLKMAKTPCFVVPDDKKLYFCSLCRCPLFEARTEEKTTTAPQHSRGALGRDLSS